MSGKSIIEKCEDFIFGLFKEKSSKENIYHNHLHTIEVVNAVKTIGSAEKLTPGEIEIATIAAWFHDIGYIDTYENHEQKSAEYAKNFLSEQSYPREKIDAVVSCILATKVPQKPKNILEEVLCDADLSHLGSKDFKDRNELYRVEKERKLGKSFSDVEWLKENIDFFSQHSFHTKYAKKNFTEKKTEHLSKLQKRLRKLIKKKQDDSLKIEKIEIEKEKLESKKENFKKAERGIETMFRNVMRTHVSFSSMADNKANIMISVNTLLLTAIIAVLARKLDSNPHLIAPTAIITLVSLVTLIYATLVTRPKITEGVFTKEDIEKKQANLLFFGNFFNMELNQFTWGMKEMMNDKDYLYDAMIKDFYFLGQVLGKKYKYLRICYNIFMYGLIVSIIAFTLAIVLYPGGTELGPILE